MSAAEPDSDKVAKSDAPSHVTNDICDEYFIRNVKELKKLRTFLTEQAITLNAAVSSLGGLNTLRYRPNGRSATETEWEMVEQQTQSYFSLLTPALRQKFLMSSIPWWVTGLPIVLASIAILALIESVLSVGREVTGSPEQGSGLINGVVVIYWYLLWLVSLGAIGSVAFIGMNALSVQQDATFDLRNARLMVLRIALGGLFGLVLSLPFGVQGYVTFCLALFAGREEAQGVTTQAIMLLLPFVLGFSTSLVIMVLNQFVDALQTFFGRKPIAPAATPPSPP
jgi:hypothetical protein